MPAGSVKFFIGSRGFGFIKPDEGGPDVFVHVTDLAPGTPPLVEDMRVNFEIGTDRKNGRQKAIDVRQE